MKKVITILICTGLFLSFTACGYKNKDTVTTTSVSSQTIVIKEENTHKTGDPLTMDINELKSLCEGYYDGKYDIPLAGETLYGILSEWDEDYDKWKAFKVDDYTDKEAFYGKTDGKYSNAFKVAGLIYYYRTKDVVGLKPPEEETTAVTTVITIDTPETFEETIEDLKKKIDEGDEDAARTYLAYFTPTSEFINSLTLKEFKAYYKEYLDFLGLSEEYEVFKDYSNEEWKNLQSLTAQACDIFNS